MTNSLPVTFTCFRSSLHRTMDFLCFLLPQFSPEKIQILNGKGNGKKENSNSNDNIPFDY